MRLAACPRGAREVAARYQCSMTGGSLRCMRPQIIFDTAHRTAAPMKVRGLCEYLYPSDRSEKRWLNDGYMIFIFLYKAMCRCTSLWGAFRTGGVVQAGLTRLHEDTSVLSSSALLTLLRPVFLATYSALSASFSQAPASLKSLRQEARPILRLTRNPGTSALR